MSEEIDIEVRDGVQVIRWRRADKRNALVGAIDNRIARHAQDHVRVAETVVEEALGQIER